MENLFLGTRVRMVQAKGESHLYCFTKSPAPASRVQDSFLCITFAKNHPVCSVRISDMGISKEKNRTFFEAFSRTVSPAGVLKEVYEEFSAE